MRVLICEDNPVIAMDLEMTIEDLGHASAGHVTRSDDCLAACRADPPDIVLVDIDLEDGPTGPALTQSLRAMGIPSVIVSGQVEDLDPAEHAAEAVLGKPVSVARLGATLDRIRRNAGVG